MLGCAPNVCIVSHHEPQEVVSRYSSTNRFTAVSSNHCLKLLAQEYFGNVFRFEILFPLLFHVVNLDALEKTETMGLALFVCAFYIKVFTHFVNQYCHLLNITIYLQSFQPDVQGRSYCEAFVTLQQLKNTEGQQR